MKKLLTILVSTLVSGAISTLAQPQCVDFSADTTTITTGGTVNFIDSSLASCGTNTTRDSYIWTFSGSGVVPSTSNDPNPTVIYNLAGTYTVRLMVFYLDSIDGIGLIEKKQKINYINVFDSIPTSPPVVDFSANWLTGDATLVVSFTDLSTNFPNQWEWSFPGGTPSTSTAQNPAVAYFSPGSYDVTLIATNIIDSSSLTKNSYINVTSDVGIDQLSIINYQLSIYPNPFKDQVSIQYYIPDQSNVILEIYNIWGQKVKVLVNELQPKGKFVYTFNTEQLNAGIYLVKLNVEDKIYRKGNVTLIR